MQLHIQCVGVAVVDLKHAELNSLCPPKELPCFQELIFEDFSRFILVENIFEEVVLLSVMKDIMMGQCLVCHYIHTTHE